MCKSIVLRVCVVAVLDVLVQATLSAISLVRRAPPARPNTLIVARSYYLYIPFTIDTSYMFISQ